MATIIGGSIAVILAVTFLGWLAISINSIPLWFAILLGIVLLVYDFVSELRSGENSGAGH